MSLITRTIKSVDAEQLFVLSFSNLSCGTITVSVAAHKVDTDFYEAVLFDPINRPVRAVTGRYAYASPSSRRLEAIHKLTTPTRDHEVTDGTLWEPARVFVDSMRDELRALAEELYS